MVTEDTWAKSFYWRWTVKIESGEPALYLGAYLRHFPIDRLRRRRPELRHKPLVLVQTTGNRQTVLHVSAETSADIVPGMALAAARARGQLGVRGPVRPQPRREAPAGEG